MGSSESMVGWNQVPDSRGTINIIYSCLLVTVTAVWTVLHLNIPGPGEKATVILVRRIRWAVLAVLAPDLLTLAASLNWYAARQSVAEMRRIGYNDWTLAHAFYANSGGFFIQCRDVRPFPVTAPTIHFLLSRGYIDVEKLSITRAEIWDKSKSNWFAKGTTVLQSTYLVFISISRVAQGLPLCPAEVFTLGFIVSTCMSYFFWLHKPQNVATPTHIKFDRAISEVIDRESRLNPEASKPFRYTPFDFIERPAQAWHRRDVLSKFDLVARPALRVPDDAVIPNLSWLVICFPLGIPSLLHSSIHLLSWNMPFPTRLEQLMWRSASLVLLVVSSCGTAPLSRLLRTRYKGRVNFCWLWVNNAPGLVSNRTRWREKLQWRALDIISTVTTLMWVLARLYLICEAVLSFRSLPMEVYQTVKWTEFIPHMQ